MNKNGQNGSPPFVRGRSHARPLKTLLAAIKSPNYSCRSGCKRIHCIRHHEIMPVFSLHPGVSKLQDALAANARVRVCYVCGLFDCTRVTPCFDMFVCEASIKLRFIGRGASTNTNTDGNSHRSGRANEGNNCESVSRVVFKKSRLCIRLFAVVPSAAVTTSLASGTSVWCLNHGDIRHANSKSDLWSVS